MALDPHLPCCDDHLVKFWWGQDPDLRDRCDGGTRRKVPELRQAGEPWLILILESPHVNEFIGAPENWGPVRGNSGSGIQNHLMTILRSSAVQERAKNCQGLVLMNAVQHQCSEGVVPLDPVRRDCNFIDLWETNRGRENFQQRLAAIYRPGDLIILACTAGSKRPRKNKPSLRGLVRDALGQMECPVVIDVACCHPCRWNNPAQRILRDGWK